MAAAVAMETDRDPDSGRSGVSSSRRRREPTSLSAGAGVRAVLSQPQLPELYPQCLHMLELLQYEHFRKELVNAQCAKFIDEQQILHWQHYSRKRMRLQQALAEQQQQNSAAGK
ncbi:mediator of RNA polymerase II transcription subunit 31 isoform X2 [Mustela erminea]|uniref:mediator of RNA polymerase II transcription subunit 31 isoform X2 n=1 Tax=Mustela erminea TaxID=36723 RepID=UPI001386C628|nr:mediator of RNA polymerase II transcription subunit 31 isoform X2 [Mustela erminea]